MLYIVLSAHVWILSKLPWPSIGTRGQASQAYCLLQMNRWIIYKTFLFFPFAGSQNCEDSTKGLWAQHLQLESSLGHILLSIRQARGSCGGTATSTKARQQTLPRQDWHNRQLSSKHHHRRISPIHTTCNHCKHRDGTYFACIPAPRGSGGGTAASMKVY